MARFLGLLVVVLTLVYGTVVSTASANAPRRLAPHGACTDVAAAVEAGGDQQSAPGPLAPADVDDDNGDDDEQEALTQPSHAFPRVCRVTRCSTSTGETLQPSLGHPRGIDDPPRY